MAVADGLRTRGLIADDAGLAVTPAGLAWLADLGIDPASLQGPRPLLLGCLDWTERRTHLAGAFGAALCRLSFERDWVQRIGSGRALRVTPAGARAFQRQFGIDPGR